jgi:hypothetical protein
VTEETLICSDGIVRTAVPDVPWVSCEELLTRKQAKEAKTDAAGNIWAALHAGVILETTTDTGSD